MTEPHILFVDDNPDDLAMYDIVLRDHGLRYRTSTCAQGEAAILFLKEAARTNTLPDLMVLDYNLPRKNGGEVLREMSADPLLRELPVVVITTAVSPTDLRALAQLPDVACLIKPFSVDDFGPVVEAVRKRLPKADE